MFRLLSQKTSLFSIPIYVGVALLIILMSNGFSFQLLNIFSNLFAFIGIILGYVLFHQIGLNRQSHLPLFLYSIFIGTFYPKDLDIGISIAIFTNAILLFFLTDDSPKLRENSYFLIGNLLATNFIFLPSTWPLYIFVILHIIATSDYIFSNILKLISGSFFMALGYFCLMYILGYTNFDTEYFPLISSEINTDFSNLYFLIPIVVMSILAIIDHFMNFNKKSPRNKFKYSFILTFLFTQCLILSFYMGQNNEYLLLIIFPVCIILSRYLRFLNKYWLQEIGFWLIVISCFLSPKFNFLTF